MPGRWKGCLLGSSPWQGGRSYFRYASSLPLSLSALLYELSRTLISDNAFLPARRGESCSWKRSFAHAP